MIKHRLRPAYSPAMAVTALCVAVAVVGAGCKTTAQTEARKRPSCAEGTYYDIRTDSCVVPKTHEDSKILGAYQLYARQVREAPDRAVLNQMSFTRWLSGDDLQSILLDPKIISVERMYVRLRIPNHGIFTSTSIPAGTSKTATLDAAFVEIARTIGDNDIVDGTTSTPLRDILPTIRTSGTFDIGAVTLRTSSPADGLDLWERQGSIIRLAIPIGVDQPTLPSPLLPGEDDE